MYLVGSSGWLEYITEDTKAAQFARYIESSNVVLIPTIIVFEVYKKLFAVHGKTFADRSYSQALQGQIVPWNEHLAQGAAVWSAEHRLPVADAIIYATAQAFQAQLITSDSHFRGLPRVTLI
jgi:toxin FitB